MHFENTEMYTNTESNLFPENEEISNDTNCKKHFLLRNNLCFQGYNISMSEIHNRYVYVKQNFLPSSNTTALKPQNPKVLVNPHFKKKVFVNPNFSINRVLPPSTSAPKIHVNPNVQKINLTMGGRDSSKIQKIHVNPTVLRSISSPLSNTLTNCFLNKEKVVDIKQYGETEISSNATLTSSVNSLSTGIESKRKRRSSVRSKYKIIKTCVLNSSRENVMPKKRRISIKSQYKIVRSCSNSEDNKKNSQKMFKNVKSPASKFKLDNRISRKVISATPKNKKYVFDKKILSISDLMRNTLKNKTQKSVVNINGVLYKKSPNSLRRTSDPRKITSSYKKSPAVINIQSKYKFIRKYTSTSKLIKLNKSRTRVTKVKIVSPRRLKTCNIPCPYYRKFGKCTGKENGICNKKHDPDQIALCTKFLQGACINTKCLLSHNVSPEKMPTCKFYLEGSCSKDDCPYLHVRISPKADICKDFLEGFCKKAAECDKRHQFLCPDFEKNGKCMKQRCCYPHGKLVRKYSVLNKNKFAKKSSNISKKTNKAEDKTNEGETVIGKDVPCSSKNEQFSKNVNNDNNVKARYYVDQSHIQEKIIPGDTNNVNNFNDDINCNQDVGLRTRPKLGNLPSFIAFEEV